MFGDFLRFIINKLLITAAATAATTITIIMIGVLFELLVVFLPVIAMGNVNGCPVNSIVAFCGGYPSLIMLKVYDPSEAFWKVT